MPLTEITTEQKMLEKLSEISGHMRTIKSIMIFWSIVIPIAGVVVTAISYF